MAQNLSELDQLVTVAEKHRGTPEGDALADAARALRAVTPDDRGSTFAITAAPGIPLDRLVETFAAQNPALAVSVIRSHAGARAVRSGAADVGVVRLPARLTGLGVTPIGAERFVVALSPGDPLAARSEVALGELTGHHLLQNPDTVPEWRELAPELRGPTIGTRKSLELGVLTTLALQLDQVAAGRGIVIVPRTLADAEPRPDVVFVAVEGLSDRALALAWRQQSPRAAVLAFAELAAGLR